MRNLLLIILLISGLMMMISCTLHVHIGGTYYKDAKPIGGITIDVPETERQ